MSTSVSASDMAAIAELWLHARPIVVQYLYQILHALVRESRHKRVYAVAVGAVTAVTLLCPLSVVSACVCSRACGDCPRRRPPCPSSHDH